MDKKTIRRQMIEIRALKTSSQRLLDEKKVYEHLVSMSIFNASKIVSSFMDFRDEISMSLINQTIIDTGKILLLPYIDTKTNVMQFYKVDVLAELKRNKFGILEPIPGFHALFEPSKIDCVLTPGVAFDENGFRLGYGGGFYDRFFSGIEKAIPKIGIAFDCQLLDSLPTSDYDLPITHLITESGVRTFIV